jgi:hypothetical protein
MSLDQLFKQANAALRAGDFAGAERRFRALTKLKPNWAFHNLGALYVAMGRLAEAEAAFRQTLAVDPVNQDTRSSLGRLFMAQGRYAEGWPLMEARRYRPGTSVRTPNVSYPEWKGEDLAGKRLLVLPEQGLGDQIQFFRFLPQLQAQGAQVTVICPPELVRLFEGRGVEVFEAVVGRRYPDSDCWTLVCTTPLHLGVTLETLPGAPYLNLPEVATDGVGVVTAGSAAHLNNHHRSLSSRAAAELAALGRDLTPEKTGARDFRDTAEIIAGLDLVISVDTSVAHLAGAMGKPVWVLLPAVDTDWRWLRDRTDSPWYPSARLYRQNAPGDWSSVVQLVARDLAARRQASQAQS